MKKKLIMMALAMLMLLQCACAVAPAVQKEPYGVNAIISNDDTINLNATDDFVSQNIVATDKVSVRGGDWANMTWRQIMDKRIDLGHFSSEMIVLKNGVSGSNGLTNNAYTRVALFKYDISDISFEDIGYVAFNMKYPKYRT